MNSIILRSSLIFFLSSFFLLGYSQKKKPSRPAKPAANSNKKPTSGYGTGGNNTTGSGYGTQPTQSSGNKPQPGVKYERADGGGSGFNDSVRQSQRNDNAIERNLVKERSPLVYEHLREDDAVYKQRIWREIDTREKMNLPFRYALVENNGNQRFISILLSALKRGDLIAFDDQDDRFTIPLTKDQVFEKLGSKIDTVPQFDLDGNIVKYKIAAREVDLDSIYKFKLKEEVVFDKESSRLFTRILGIAPVMPVTLSNGTSLGQFRTLFWVYYPDLRSTLARYEIFNPKNFGARMSWEDLFEGRMFSSYITKSTFDNPFDQSLKEKYGKNTLFALLEGEAIKEKIFNYEQNLWAY